ncbi:SPOR domain-containing protein [Zestomonas carbonaria]|uniref:Cell division protein DedD n=1 Tax=Zestomonas carbonaria TaxID=2762745 RepID=A0A7U7IAU3_9GAMM|nr:SPOR domain-containing protein [Pseudomonas carbonaria]CAD5109750.1 Cell division protein DedD [Pseudomonas carbonaria]
MALLDKGLKQRIVGALVLVALAVIFLPMLLTREDETRHVVVDAPSMPRAPAVPEITMDPVAVPEPQPLPDEPIPADPAADGLAEQPVPEAPSALAAEPAPKPSAPAKAPVAAAPQPATPAAKPAPASRLDANSLPVSWSIQLASLSNRASAENLQQTLRSKGYNAYIRTADGMNRVFVGPVIERAEADRLRDQLNRQQKLNGFVVRFQPERG